MPHYPKPNNPLVCKVALIFQRDTRELVNTFHVARTTGWDISSMTALGTAIVSWYNSVYKAALPTTVALSQVQVRQLNPASPLAVDIPVTPASPGTRGGPTEAGNASVTMSERTGFAGRAYRGRMYAAAVPSNDVTSDDKVSSALVTLLGNAIGNLVFGALPAGDLLAVFHRPGLVPKPLDNLYTVVNTYILENIIDSQRRRLPGRGR